MIKYYKNQDPIDMYSKSIVINIDTIESKQQILDIYKNELNFTDYFGDNVGRNWDAFNDSMRYLDQWLESEYIYVYHSSQIGADRDTLKVYIDILCSLSVFWTKYTEIKIRFYFLEEDAAIIEPFIKEYSFEEV